jgi:NADH-quinone oxidoreductase subunit J
MSIVLLAFFLFAAVTILSALMVVAARHPVHAVLWLILAFFNAAGLFLLAGAEFLAMILVIVYVGAVAVLFLFVVMMLDVDFAALKQGFWAHLPLGGLVGGILLAELLTVAFWWQSLATEKRILADPLSVGVDNTRALGLVLYTDYFLIFQTAAMILLVAMIGAIVLTLRHRPGVLRQNIAAQVERKRGDAITITKVTAGGGVELGE